MDGAHPPVSTPEFWQGLYGLTLILFIIFLPSGIWGSLTGAWRRRRAAAGPPRPAAA